MHFLCSPKRSVGLGYRHRGLICPIIHVLNPNINIVVHNSSNGEENMNLPLPEELPLGTPTRRVAWLRRVYKIRNRF
jgi:hypothetical protein